LTATLTATRFDWLVIPRSPYLGNCSMFCVSPTWVGLARQVTVESGQVRSAGAREGVGGSPYISNEPLQIDSPTEFSDFGLQARGMRANYLPKIMGSNPILTFRNLTGKSRTGSIRDGLEKVQLKGKPMLDSKKTRCLARNGRRWQTKVRGSTLNLAPNSINYR
jgi:hypothetical protein